MVAIDQRRSDTDVEPAADDRCLPDQAHDHLELARRADVALRDLRDALVVDVGERHPRSERDRSENRHLGGSIRAPDVLGRIGFGVPEALCLRERVGVLEALLHPRKDEVRRPVDDAEHAAHIRDDERLAKHLDHGDRRADGRLEAKLDAGGRRRAEEIRATLGQQLLVGGDDGLSRGEELRR